MFTGLIAAVGEVRDVRHDGPGAVVCVATELAAELAEGDSIAVNGVCLTATSVSDSAFEADAMAETLRRSSLATLRAGSRVNLELAMRVGDRLGGHIVQGHVDGVGELVEIVPEGSSQTLAFTVDRELATLLVLKGSVALDGVSLTVSGLGTPETGRFSVSLIPETLSRTTLGELRAGGIVNVEVDVLAKHVQRLIASTLTVG